MTTFDYINLLQQDQVTRVLIVTLSVMIGYLLGKIAGRAIERGLSPRLDQHQVMIFRRGVFYGVLVLATLTGLTEAGINLSVLVGAAGVVSVAVGFASQTTMSNLISGVFMLFERPFTIGDTIKIGSTVGEVSIIGLFSTILKTPENMMVRIPNEFLMKSEITNMTRFPLRRIELLIGVSYAVDIANLRDVISSCINELSFIKRTPSPEVNFRAFGDHSIQVSVGVWVERERANEVLSLLADTLKKLLERADISLPVPQRELTFSPEKNLRVEVISKT